MLRVILVLDLLKRLVVGAVEALFPLRVAEVTLAEVSGSSGDEVAELGCELVGDHLHGILHRLPRDLVAPGSDDEQRDHGVAPARVDGVVGSLSGGARSVETETDDGGAMLVQEAEGVDDGLAVIQDGVPGQQSSGVDVGVDGQGLVHGGVELGVAVEVAEVAGVADAHAIKLLHERSDEFAELG